MYTPQTAQAVVRLHQLLLAMMPRRWSFVRLDAKRDDAGRFVHLTNLDAQIAPGGGAKPPPLGRDQNALVADMNAADPSVSPRDQLARDIMDARKQYQQSGTYTPGIRAGLQSVIAQNKAAWPGTFDK